MEYFDGKGDGDFNTLRLIVEGRPFQDTCGIRILGLPEVDAAIRELCAHLRVPPEAVQTRSQFILAMEHFMASDLPEAQKVVLVQRLTQAIFRRSADQLADSTDLAGMVGHRVMARAAAGGHVTLAEFEQLARLEHHRDQVAGTQLASQAPA
ncbi:MULTISPECIES: hypothetical protein [Pseudomonas]|uniref:Uncharacterized protein n=2 Tax=Pseudomonas TaxID=286 RepID=A0A7G8A9R5_PSEAI|nr:MULTISPECIES: hypothetical protein [Pseudomonas]ALZ46251.1 Hypothetical protein [Pseudomonas putida]QNI15736.1 Hypothetical protein [Pseudomonas aeruginosa]QNI16686.1 Hypothetical protein [Pseudomonas aeruginosa]QNI17180.1 Hypothetical protein [Pseudomonas sp.]WHV80408.1 hypothetical protein M2I96_32100 [Pseudomonas aeruginosa]